MPPAGDGHDRRIDPLRILLAHSFYRAPGGEDGHVRQQIELLAAHHDVALFSKRNDELSQSLNTVSTMLHSSRMKGEVVRELVRFRPDIVHVHNVYPSLGPAVHLACAELGIPLVMTVHNYRIRCPNGLMFTEGSICRRCERGAYVSAVIHDCFPDWRQSAAYATVLWIHRFVLRMQDKVALFIGPSRFMRDRLTEWGIPYDRTTVIPNFVVPVNMPSDPGTYGVFLGRISPEKGVHVLIRALAKAGDPPFKIIGDGPIRQAMQSLARDVGLRSTEFLGTLPRPEVQRVLEACRYLVMPSLSEEVAPISALEAMSHARAILVSPLGGLKELVRDGGGLTAHPGDVDDLAGKIGLLHEDDELCLHSGKKAWELCRREYSPTAHLERLQEAYAALVSG